MGHEIRKHYQYGGELVPVMLAIAEGLTDEEAEMLRPWCDDKLVELQQLADGYCIFGDLGQVIGLWDGEEGDEDEDEDDGIGEDNEEDEDANGDERGS